MAKTGRSAEVVFDTRDLERAARIAEDDPQLSAIPVLGLAGEKGVVNLVIAKADPNSLRATGDYRQLNLSGEDKDLLASLVKQGDGDPAVVGLIRPHGQIEVRSKLAGRALTDNDVLKLDGGERDLLSALMQQVVATKPKLTVVVSDTPLGPKMAVWGNSPDMLLGSQPQIVTLGKRRK